MYFNCPVAPRFGAPTPAPVRLKLKITDRERERAEWTDEQKFLFMGVCLSKITYLGLFIVEVHS